jgi:hypothetical protein
MSDVTILHYAELLAFDPGRFSGGQRRFYCPIHQGDHQRSLSIVEDGEKAGVGHCHACHVDVIVEDWPGRPERQSRAAPARSQAARVARILTLVPRDEAPPSPDESLITLRSLWPRTRARANDDRAQAYLTARGIDEWVAAAGDVGYIPADAKLSGLMRKWVDRLIFPLWRPGADGEGYAGRAVALWESGMDENTHKALLESSPIRRWEKTNVAGWYAVPEMSETVIIVEGPLDALAVLATGMDRGDVVALVGTACQARWFPKSVKRVVLSLDGDATGLARADTIAHDLRAEGIAVIQAPPSDDGMGKDASERYRHDGINGLAYLFEAWEAINV